LSKADSLL